MIAQPDRGRRPVATTDEGPTVLRIALGGQLRQLREAAEITREAAGDAIRASHAKISRLELGRVGFKERDVRDLLTLYGILDEAERSVFLELARRANTPGWWHRFGDVLPAWFETYIGLEQAASSIRTYETQFVPGLLQTPSYARAVIALGAGRDRPADIERRVELRMKRQSMLGRAKPPTLWAVVDEAVLRRPVGGIDVTREQIRHLQELTLRPNISIQILPYAAGGHAAAGGSFSLLRFAQPDLPDIVYTEQLTSALYLDKRLDIEVYLGVIDRLAVEAEQPARTAELLAEFATQF